MEVHVHICTDEVKQGKVSGTWNTNAPVFTPIWSSVETYLTYLRYGETVCMMLWWMYNCGGMSHVNWRKEGDDINWERVEEEESWEKVIDENESEVREVKRSDSPKTEKVNDQEIFIFGAGGGSNFCLDVAPASRPRRPRRRMRRCRTPRTRTCP